MLRWYYTKTAPGRVPQWYHALQHFQDKQEAECAGQMEWDYGLSMDVELLCMNRGGSVPFQWEPHLWDTLYVRDRKIRRLGSGKGN